MRGVLPLVLALCASAALADDDYHRESFSDDASLSTQMLIGTEPGTIIYRNGTDMADQTVVYDIQVPNVGLVRIEVYSDFNPRPDTATVIDIPDGFIIRPLTVTINEGDEAVFVIEPYILG